MRQFLSRDRALGAIIGFGLGLLILSLIAEVMRGTVIYLLAFSFGLILIPPLYYGVKFGVSFLEERKLPTLSWPMLAVVAVVLWPAAIGLPFGIQFLRLKVFTAREIPVYPLAQQERTSVEWGDGVNHGDRVHLLFLADASASDVVQFYRDELLAIDWVEGPAHFIEGEFDGTPYWFTKNTGTRIHDMHIKVGSVDSEGRTNFEVIYGI